MLNETRDKGTVVGQLTAQNRALKNIINADPSATVDSLQDQVNNAGVSGSLLGEVKRLNAELQAAQQRVDDALAARDQAQEAANDAESRAESIKQAFGAAQEELSGQVQGNTQEAATFLAKINELDQKFQGEMADIRAEMQQTIDQQQQQLLEKDRRIAELQRIIDDIPSGRADVDPITLPDGRIVSITTDGNQVYIDRGRQDRLMLGMTFEVYDSGDLVKLDEFDEARGKATVEVIDLDERNAVARVVRLKRGSNLKEGDQLINVAFDPNATLKFYVYGDFDIENTGEPSRADRRRIENMIQRWGGELADDLGPDVDYLVLGSEPPTPDPLPPGETNPQKIQAFVQATKEYETYQNLKGEARLMTVPMLNQNRFLSLIGFYER